ncbi:MAG: acyl-CoA carboxylase subunit epsilon [Mycobacteriales bacterium]
MTEPRTPLLRVLRGDPDDAELAALTVVALRLAAARPSPAAPAKPSWGERRPLLRTPLVVGPGRWRASALPGR